MDIDPPEIRIDTTTRPKPRPPASAPPQWLAGLFGLLLTIAGMGAWMTIGPRIMAGGAASEMEQQYQILLDISASEMDLGIRAGAVADLYLHAHDRTQYAKWKAISDVHMRRAGISVP